MNERLAIFDILKGIGILLVIVGHTFMKEIGPYILAFHMPLFFIVAGYFFKYKPIKVQIKRDFRRLIVPYFFVVFITFLIASLKNFRATGTIDFHLGTLYECGTPAWFLLALFGAKQIFNIVYKHDSYNYLLYAFILSSIPCLITHFVDIDPVLAIGSSICGVFFYAVGYYVKVNGILERIENYQSYAIVISFLLWLNTSIWGEVDMHYCIFKLWLLDFMGACSGVYLCYILSKFVEKSTKRIKMLLAQVGYYSFVIYSFHAIEYVFPDWHQIASFSDGTALRPFVILICRLLLADVFVLITINCRFLKNMFFPSFSRNICQNNK